MSGAARIRLGAVLLGLSLCAFARADAQVPATPPPDTTVTDTTASASHPDLNGVWNLDERAGDDVQAFAKKVADAFAREQAQRRNLQAESGDDDMYGGGFGGEERSFSRDVGSGNRSRGGREGPGGPGGPRGRDGDADAKPGARLAAVLRQLLISGDGQTVEIMDGSDRSATYVADGEFHADKSARGNVTLRATWQDDTLVLERIGNPLTIVRRLRLAPQPARLLVEVSVQTASGQEMSAHLEYSGIP